MRYLRVRLIGDCQMSQVQLSEQYQKQLDSVNNHEFFENANKCGVCGSTHVEFHQRENGVVRTCVDCAEHEQQQRDERDELLEAEN